MGYPDSGEWIWLSQCADLRLAFENHRDELSELLPVELEALTYQPDLHVKPRRNRRSKSGSFGFYPVFPIAFWELELTALELYENEFQNIAGLKK